MKVCSQCRRTFFETEFYTNKATQSGFDNFCKECRKEYTKKYRGRYKDPRFYICPARILISQGNMVCACCGNKNGKWLQVDHIIPVKKGRRLALDDLSRRIILGSLSPKEFQLLCSNCNFAKKDLDKCSIDHTLD